MRRHCNCNKGALGLCFACGLLLSCFCPSKLLIAILAIWVIVLGISCTKCGFK